MIRNLPRVLISSIALCGLLSTASAYELLGLKWSDNSMQLDYDFELDGDRASPSGVKWNQAFDDAAGDWNRKVNFTIATDDSDPSHPCAGVHPYYADGFRNGAAFHHELCFQGQNDRVEEFGDRVLAVTITYSFTDKPDEIVESDMFFNDAEGWDVYDGTLRTLFDFRRVAKHEMGHVLGLDHEEAAVALMQPNVSDLYTIQADDISGAAALYGPLESNQKPIVMSIEEPFNDSVQSGISTFRGWVVSLNELSSLRLYLNGNYKGELDHGGPRNDVCKSYGDYPGCAESGFAFAFAYGILPEGYNSYRLVARDVRGNSLEKTVDFQVTRFDDAYVGDPNKVTLANATVGIDKGREEIIIDNFKHNGKNYKIHLKWKTQSQSLEATDIIRK
jgi:hypothetical protein